MFIAPRMTSHEKSSAAQSSRSKIPSAHALRQIALTVRVSAMSALILSPEALAARNVATWGAEMCANGPPAELAPPPREAAPWWESMEGGTGRRALMSRSSRCETRKACSGAKASACGTTRGITGTASLPFERICGREMGMRGICAQLAARTMWCAGTRKTESVVGCLEDGLDCTARMCVTGAAPRVGTMSKEEGRRERGSCGGTTAAVTEAMSLWRRGGKKAGKNREKREKKADGQFRKMIWKCVWNVLFSPRVQAFPNILEGHLAEVGLHGQNSLPLHLRERRAIEGAGQLEVGKRCSGVLVLVHLVVVLLSWASCNVEHVESLDGGI